MSDGGAGRPCPPVTVARPAALGAIRDTKINIAIWRRPVMLATARYAERVLNVWPSDIDLVAQPKELRRQLARALPHVTGARMGRAQLLSDVGRLASTYAGLAARTALHLKLERVSRDKCPLFHTDFVTLRLLTSYSGPGTEWLPEHAVDRRALGSGSNDQIITDRRKIRHLNPFWVGFLKGEAFGPAEGHGCVHRSPLVESRGVARLLLTIDDLIL
jgi:hypothetical protein